MPTGEEEQAEDAKDTINIRSPTMSGTSYMPFLHPRKPGVIAYAGVTTAKTCISMFATRFLFCVASVDFNFFA